MVICADILGCTVLSDPKHCVILVTGCHTGVKASCFLLGPNCSPELAHTHVVHLLAAAQHLQTNNLTDTDRATGTQCRCWTPGGNEKYIYPGVPLPTYHCCANIPKMRAAQLAVLSVTLGVTAEFRCRKWQRRLRRFFHSTPCSRSMCAHTFLMTACLSSSHSLELSDRAPAPQTETRSHEEE